MFVRIKSIVSLMMPFIVVTLESGLKQIVETKIALIAAIDQRDSKEMDITSDAARSI